MKPKLILIGGPPFVGKTTAAEHTRRIEKLDEHISQVGEQLKQRQYDLQEKFLQVISHCNFDAVLRARMPSRWPKDTSLGVTLPRAS